MATNYTICSNTDIKRLSSRGGSTGLKYPWFDPTIKVGSGFFIERSIQDINQDKGRPSIPTKSLEQYGIRYRTYKGEFNGRYGYYCERVK
ncbi:hypothetical protein [Synechococcus phage S-H9-2]|uniref:Uncharacterized protein n=1 Tax=Synechococcus phage S-H9-2 TaxID=2783669 RepID=A0A873WH88_9CAUD|nr:hypothetical protein PQC10_gp045 [Synechococcus phage S-H9-2]QPB08322.1 hypothetical protein [Synechococcus phage S-H9-2]